MPSVNEISVQGTVHDIHDKRIPENEQSVNVKPLWYHPIYAIEYNENKIMFSCTIINNDNTPYTFASFCSLVESGTFRLAPISGTLVRENEKIDLHSLLFTHDGSNNLVVYAYGRKVDDGSLVNARVVTSDWNAIKAAASPNCLDDSPNKLN